MRLPPTRFGVAPKRPPQQQQRSRAILPHFLLRPGARGRRRKPAFPPNRRSGSILPVFLFRHGAPRRSQTPPRMLPGAPRRTQTFPVGAVTVLRGSGGSPTGSAGSPRGLEALPDVVGPFPDVLGQSGVVISRSRAWTGRWRRRRAIRARNVEVPRKRCGQDLLGREIWVWGYRTPRVQGQIPPCGGSYHAGGMLHVDTLSIRVKWLLLLLLLLLNIILS